MNKYGLIGKSLQHSFSKDYFTQKFQKEKLSATYENIELSNAKELKDWFDNSAHFYKGVNITIPYKEKIIPFLEELSPEATEIGAVNTILFHNGKSKGFNTDTYGFKQSIQPFLRKEQEKALILGTGGASKAIAYVLEELGRTVTFLSRNAKGERILHYNQVDKDMVNAYKLIVNCTPAGMFPKEELQPDFPIHWVGKDHLVVDLIYNPAETLFLKKAKENGAEILNGYSMLQYQANKAWEIWNS